MLFLFANNPKLTLVVLVLPRWRSSCNPFNQILKSSEDGANTSRTLLGRRGGGGEEGRVGEGRRGEERRGRRGEGEGEGEEGRGRRGGEGEEGRGGGGGEGGRGGGRRGIPQSCYQTSMMCIMSPLTVW